MDENKAQALKLVEKMWELYPEWRLGQLIANVSDWADVKIWDIEDEALVVVMHEHLQNRKSN